MARGRAPQSALRGRPGRTSTAVFLGDARRAHHHGDGAGARQHGRRQAVRRRPGGGRAGPHLRRVPDGRPPRPRASTRPPGWRAPRSSSGSPGRGRLGRPRCRRVRGLRALAHQLPWRPLRRAPDARGALRTPAHGARGQRRPAYLHAYWGELDTVGHRHGAGSDQYATAVQAIDRAIGQILLDGLRAPRTLLVPRRPRPDRHPGGALGLAQRPAGPARAAAGAADRRPAGGHPACVPRLRSGRAPLRAAPGPLRHRPAHRRGHRAGALRPAVGESRARAAPGSSSSCLERTG